MKNDWILDVLADLRGFAQTNGLPSLAEQLRLTSDLAAVEIASAEAKASSLDGDDYSIGNLVGEAGVSKRA